MSFTTFIAGLIFEFIHRAMPRLTRAEFDAVVEYVDQHREALIAEDLEVEAHIQRQIAAQRKAGLIPNDNLTLEERKAILKEKLQQLQRAEKNGAQPAG